MVNWKSEIYKVPNTLSSLWGRISIWGTNIDWERWEGERARAEKGKEIIGIQGNILTPGK